MRHAMPVAALQAAASPPPLVLDDATLGAVARALMGRTDVADLVGRATLQDLAERVRRARRFSVSSYHV
jgi:hypothetical protein